MTIYVGNLSYDVTEADLSNIFAEYGSVKRVKLPVGFGLVDLETAAEVDAAIENLDGAEWMTRTIKVNKARPRTPRDGAGGGRGGQRNFSQR